jgi:hypothetical protein
MMCPLSGVDCDIVVYYETIKRDLNKRLIYYDECRCDERLKPKDERSTCLTYTVLRGGLEHLKIETRLTNERFASAMGECVIVTLKVWCLYSK